MTGLKQDWGLVAAELDGQGWGVLPGLMADADCERIAASYDRDDIFRSRVVMARHGFGRGEYRYFSYPLPHAIEKLMGALDDQDVAAACRFVIPRHVRTIWERGRYVE